MRKLRSYIRSEIVKIVDFYTPNQKFIELRDKKNDLASIRMTIWKEQYSVLILYWIETRKAPHFCEALSFLVAGTGLEPVTFGLWARRATYCSIPRYIVISKCQFYRFVSFFIILIAALSDDKYTMLFYLSKAFLKKLFDNPVYSF